MTVSLKHSFTSEKEDSSDTSLVQPSNWNAEHSLTCASGILIGRATAGTGSAEEIGLGSGLSFSGGNLVVSGFASSSHTHVISDVTGLQSALDGKQAAGSYQPLATVLTNTTAAFTTAQETKLAGIATGATANSSDATLLDRANHTGSQAISTITGLQTALDGKQSSVASGVATVTIPSARLEWEETVTATGVTPSSSVTLCLAPASDDDENDPTMLSLLGLAATPGTDEITVAMGFGVLAQGPINLNWSAL